MAKQMVLYRGSLKSCNFSCSYCPFSKHKSTERQLLKDKEQWIRFCRSIEKMAYEETPDLYVTPQNPVFSQPKTGAVMVVPYGEALLHPWYWEGLGLLSALKGIEAAGAQTNLSFLLKDSLRLFDQAGGQRHKLRLWATFHPEMVSVSRFVRQCRELQKEGVQLCAGAVGVPENLDLLRSLREELPKELYLWINPMDGLKRPYTEKELASFRAIDPWFSNESAYKKSDPSQCQNRLFVEGSGALRLCNISRTSKFNWYEAADFRAFFASPACGRSVCSCYLAYGGRRDYEHGFAFGRYPLFRIPWKPKAFFLDLDGTLIPEGKTGPVPETLEQLQRLSKDCLLFLATSLPFKEAFKQCCGFFHLFSGGVFAGGAHILLKGAEKKELFIPLDPALPPMVTACLELFKNNEEAGAGANTSRKKAKIRLQIYVNQQAVYKITLSKPPGKAWDDKEFQALKARLSGCSFRCFIEKNCLQIVAPGADKGQGVKALCHMLGILPGDTAAVGNSEEDIAMFKVCGYGIAVSASGQAVREAADMVL